MALPEIWFDDIQDKLTLEGDEWRAIARWAFATLTGSESPPAWPDRLTADERPRFAFLSLSDGERPATVVYGSGIGLRAALDAAIVAAQGHPPIAPLQCCKLDIVQSAIASERLNLERPFRYDRSLYGLAYERDSQIALLPEELVGHQLIDTERKLDLDRMSRYLAPRPGQADTWQALQTAPRLKFYRFACRSFATDGRDVWLLYRGHRCFNAIAPTDLMNAAQRGGRYLRRHQTSDGRFVYCYHGSRDRVTIGYNLRRHAGAASALLDLYEVTGELEFLDSAQGSLDYLLLFSQSSLLAPEIGSCIVEDGFAELGTTALAAIALTKYNLCTRQRHYLPQLMQFARHLQAAQQPSGAFFSHRQVYPDGEDTLFVSRRYSSQAVLAMTYLYKLTQRESWLARAEAGARYLLTVTKRPPPECEDYWLLHSLSELFCHLRNPNYHQQAEQMAAAIAQQQHRRPQPADWLGSFGKLPSATETAARLEGLCSVYTLVHSANVPVNERERERRHDTIWLAGRFLLQLQCEPEGVMYLPQPARARDGFRQHLTDFTIRLDDVYRSVMGLIAVYRLTGEPIDPVVRYN